MTDFFFVASWPGVAQIRSCQYTNSHGITPGVAILEILPQYDNFQAEGTLTFIANGGPVISLPDAKVDSFSFERNDSGLVWRLAIMDRRWKWKFGRISGNYNVRKDNGDLQSAGNRNQSLIGDTEKTPQQLARLCLEAIGERNFDISKIPNNTRPEVNWEMEVPMQALANLCDELGCRIMLDNNSNVKICVAGEGRELPESQWMRDDSGTIDPPNLVKKLTIEGGRTLWQHDFELEAVGEDTDGSIKKLQDLSYAPSGGWASVDLDNFNQISDTKCRELAKTCIFKWYRVKTPVNIPSFGTINSIEQMELTDNQLVMVSDYDSNGKLKDDRTNRAIVFGDFYQKNGDYTNTGSTQLPLVVTKNNLKYVITGFSMDREKGIVQLSNPTYKLNGKVPNATIDPASLKLRCAVNVRNEKTRAWIRHEKSRGTGNPELAIKRDDLVVAYRPDKNNKKEIEQQMDYYLDTEMKKFQIKNPQARTYNGLIPIELDGAIQQVNYSVSQGGSFTKASRCNDQDINSPSYDEKRFAEKLRTVVGKKPLSEEFIRRLR